MKISVCVDAVYAGKDMRDAIDDVLACSNILYKIPYPVQIWGLSIATFSIIRYNDSGVRVIAENEK